MFNAAVINLVSGVQESGQTVNYQYLSDGITSMEALALALGGDGLRANELGRINPEQLNRWSITERSPLPQPLPRLW
jgi:hypothetical protein